MESNRRFRMKHGSILASLVYILCAMVLTPSGGARAGEGCGWDYPCPPEPSFGRRHYPPQGQVYIHNNYGNVNIYLGGSRRHEPYRESTGALDCRDGACACGGYPCDEDCGPLCWMRRFKYGYCGHGCWAYREEERRVTEARAEEEARRAREYEREEREVHSYCYGYGTYVPPRCPRPHYRWPHSYSYSPRERFEGPAYPVK
jgi:hypothetical protein